MTNFRSIFLTFIFVFVLAGYTTIEVSRLGNQEPPRSPSVSSPAVEMAPNGDRVSPYPPYFHPTK
jgi:hypothetical protein